MVAIGVVVNPRAGGGRAGRLVPVLAEALRGVGEPARIHVTAEPRHAFVVARRLVDEGARLVVAVGGDGTCNEVANGLLADEGTGAALGVVAAGRGNDLAAALGVPRAPRAALLGACAGQARAIDVARVTPASGRSRFLINTGGLGIDGAVAERAAAGRLPGRRAPYLAALAAVLPRFDPFVATVEADGGWFEGPVLSVVVGNGAAFGGGFSILPGARLDDGVLDVAVIGDVSAWDVVRYLPRLSAGGHFAHPKVRRFGMRAMRVEVRGGRAVPLQIDGEVAGVSGRVEFEVVPGRLRVAR